MSVLAMSERRLNEIATLIIDQSNLHNGCQYVNTIDDVNYCLATSVKREDRAYMFINILRYLNDKTYANAYNERLALSTIQYNESRASKTQVLKNIEFWLYNTEPETRPERKVYKIMKNMYHKLSVQIIHETTEYQEASWS